jgi:hypothetical protein
MALTITVARRGVSGPSYYTDADVTGDASYPTGGEALAAADLVKILGRNGGAAGDIQYMDSEVATGTGIVWQLDRANTKLMAWDGNAEVADTTNLSAVTARCRFWHGQVTG